MMMTALRRAAHRTKLLAHRAGFDVTRETFKRHFVRALQERGVDVVLDVGANVGQFGSALRRAGFAGSIVSVEPLAAAYARLTQAAAHDAGWTVLRAGVGADVGSLTMNVSANSVSSSVLPMLDRHTNAAPQSAYVATEDVSGTTVDELVKRHDLAPESTLLKIDVQGYELPVLRGAADTIDRFAAVRTEMSLVALYDGQALLPDLLAELDGHGFELWTLERGFVEPTTGRLLQVDGVFFRRSR
ncbi:MAG: FkbM family methyltransferase [Jatrophihabitans sp.]